MRAVEEGCVRTVWSGSRAAFAVWLREQPASPDVTAVAQPGDGPTLRAVFGDRVRLLEPDPECPIPTTVLASGDLAGRWGCRLAPMGDDVHATVFRELTDRHHLDEIERTFATLTPVVAPGSGAGGLRGYQRSAADAWVAAGERGLLAMATGTGKTRTAGAIIAERVGRARSLVIILVPMTHLADQWIEALGELDIPAIACHTATSAWEPDARRTIENFRAQVTDAGVLVTTYATAELPGFVELVSTVPAAQRLVIVDECHNLQGVRRAAALGRTEAATLGLSATPERWNDPDGTEEILDTLGPVVTRYTLGDAIRDDVLTPYRYEVEGFALTDEELARFTAASDRYSLELAREIPDVEAIERARLARAEALDSAEGKVAYLRRALRRTPPDRTIVYCASMKQLDAAVAACRADGFSARRFTGEETRAERRELLGTFASGDLEVLIAIRCLDEGVDVPEAREAYLLKSSGNPAQYVQRRGRLLRKADGKDEAVIRDLVPSGAPAEVMEHERARIKEFAADASNGEEAMDQFVSIGGSR